MGIKAVFFDIDDTLLPSCEFTKLARRNAVRGMIESGMDVGFDKAFDTLEEVVKEKGSNYQKHFHVLCKKLGYGESSRLIAAGIAAYHNTKAGILPFPETIPTLLKLRDNGFALYVATDGKAIKQWDKLIRMRIHLLFHDVFVSEEIGCRKSRRFFRRVLRKIDRKPGECMMVGDLVKRDIEPAREVGMKAVRIVKEGEKPKGKYEIRRLDELIEILGVG